MKVVIFARKFHFFSALMSIFSLGGARRSLRGLNESSDLALLYVEFFIRKNFPRVSGSVALNLKLPLKMAKSNIYINEGSETRGPCGS